MKANVYFKQIKALQTPNEIRNRFKQNNQEKLITSFISCTYLNHRETQVTTTQKSRL